MLAKGLIFHSHVSSIEHTTVQYIDYSLYAACVECLGKPVTVFQYRGVLSSISSSWDTIIVISNVSTTYSYIISKITKKIFLSLVFRMLKHFKA